MKKRRVVDRDVKREMKFYSSQASRHPNLSVFRVGKLATARHLHEKIKQDNEEAKITNAKKPLFHIN